MPARVALVCGLVAALALGAGAARAGGLLVQEAANPRNGTAQAGQAAYAYDAATSLYDPAGMARLEEPELMVGLQPLWTDVEFDRDRATTFRGDGGGQQGGFVPGLGTFYARPLGERFAVGASLVGLVGGARRASSSSSGFATATCRPTSPSRSSCAAASTTSSPTRWRCSATWAGRTGA
jgi:long-subunit fatty acid transport protein